MKLLEELLKLTYLGFIKEREPQQGQTAGHGNKTSQVKTKEREGPNKDGGPGISENKLTLQFFCCLQGMWES